MTRWRAPERQTPVAAATETGAKESNARQARSGVNGITPVWQKVGFYLLAFILIDAVPIVLIALATLSVFDAVARYAGVRG